MPRRPALPPAVRDAMDPNTPEPGMWEIRLVRGGPWMPASISWSHYEPGSNDTVLLERPILIANVGWKDADPLKVWTARRRKVLGREEYELLMARVSWIKDFAPDEPEAQPTKPVELGILKPIGPVE